VRAAGKTVSLASRPVLFEFARALGEAWPEDIPRDVLLARAFGAKLADESHRARLRVEIGRLRKMLRTPADVTATKRGFALAPRRAREVIVLARPVEDEHAAVLALLADGESWSSSAWRWRLVPASAPCSGHSTRSRNRARFSRSVVGGLAVGWPATDQPWPLGRGRQFAEVLEVALLSPARECGGGRSGTGNRLEIPPGGVFRHPSLPPR
jgi:hypothetical protein